MELQELKYVREKEDFLERGQSVLLVGANPDCAAHVCEIVGYVYAIEHPDVRSAFEPVSATHRNFRPTFGNPLDVAAVKATRGAAIDVLIHALPIAFFNSVKILEKELEVVRPGGLVLMEIETKGQTPEDVERSSTTFLESIGLSQLRFFKGINSVYVLAVNRFKQKTLDAIVLT